MVWYFIGVYIINRTLHGRLEIRNFSSRVEKIFHSFAALTREIFFQHSKRNFVSPSGHVMFFLLYRQKDIDKIIEGNYRHYVIDKLTCEIMENKPLGSRM